METNTTELHRVGERCYLPNCKGIIRYVGEVPPTEGKFFFSENMSTFYLIDIIVNYCLVKFLFKHENSLKTFCVFGKKNTGSAGSTFISCFIKFLIFITDLVSILTYFVCYCYW